MKLGCQSVKYWTLTNLRPEMTISCGRKARWGEYFGTQGSPLVIALFVTANTRLEPQQKGAPCNTWGRCGKPPSHHPTAGSGKHRALGSFFYPMHRFHNNSSIFSPTRLDILRLVQSSCGITSPSEFDMSCALTLSENACSPKVTWIPRHGKEMHSKFKICCVTMVANFVFP